MQANGQTIEDPRTLEEKISGMRLFMAVNEDAKPPRIAWLLIKASYLDSVVNFVNNLPEWQGESCKVADVTHLFN